MNLLKIVFNKKRIPTKYALFAFHSLLFCFSYFSNINIRLDEEIWPQLADPKDYLNQSKASWTNSDLYMPERKEKFYPRPFTVPVIYKLAGSNPDSIIILQITLHFLSGFLLAFAIGTYFTNKFIYALFLICWYAALSWWQVIDWAHCLISESISMSLFFAWACTFLLIMLKNMKGHTIALHCFCLILLSFTRDTWPYFYLLFYAFISVTFFLFKHKALKLNCVLTLFGVFVFLLQNHTSEKGIRYQLPVLNNIVYRILPDSIYTSWFVEKGLPMAEELKSNYNQIDDPKMIYPLYDDTRFEPLKD